MCLMLYLGTERPVVAAPALGPLMLERIAHDEAPTALMDQASIYRIGSRLPHEPQPEPESEAALYTDTAPARIVQPGCACVFRETDQSASLGAYSGLRTMLQQILTGPRDTAGLFGCWSGEERGQPAVEMTVSVAELSADIELFSDVIHGWPILMRVTAPTAARRAVAAGDY